METLDPIVAEDIRRILDSAGDLIRELSGSSIFIAGANGFLGSYLVDTIVAANHNLMRKKPATVIALTRTPPEHSTRFQHLLQDPQVSPVRTGASRPTDKSIVSPSAISASDRRQRRRRSNGVKFVQGDLTESFVMPERVDYLIHVASKASPKAWAAQPIETADVNTIGTRRLLEVARANPVQGFLFVSSAQIYGDAGPALAAIPEDFGGTVSPLNLRASYHEAKRFGETLCYLFHHVHQVPAKIARPFSVYGPRVSLSDGKIIPEFLRRALAGEELSVLGEGGAVNTFSYVTDAIDGLLRVLVRGQAGEAYNVGSDEEISVRDLAHLFQELFPGVAVKNVPASRRIAQEPRLVPDLGKIEALGYRSRVSLRDGIARFKEWHIRYGGEGS